MKKLGIIIVTLFALSACQKTIDLSVEAPKEDEAVIVEKEEKAEGRVSSKDNLLSLGQIGRASKYNTIDKDFQEVDVKLIKVERNYQESIENFVKKANHQTVMIEYEVKLVNFETETFGNDSLLSAEVLNLSTEALIYQDIKQVIDIKVIEKDEKVLKNNEGRTKIVFQVPSETESFLLLLGETGKTRAYFKID